jgi:hypothetical protein
LVYIIFKWQDLKTYFHTKEEEKGEITLIPGMSFSGKSLNQVNQRSFMGFARKIGLISRKSGIIFFDETFGRTL